MAAGRTPVRMSRSAVLGRSPPASVRSSCTVAFMKGSQINSKVVRPTLLRFSRLLACASILVFKDTTSRRQTTHVSRLFALAEQTRDE